VTAFHEIPLLDVHWRIAEEADRLQDEVARVRYDPEHLIHSNQLSFPNQSYKSNIQILPGAPTAPNKIASNFFNVCSPSSGIYFPVFLYTSLLQSKFVNSRLNVLRVEASLVSTVMPAEITSGPMPSAGMEAILYVGVVGEMTEGLILDDGCCCFG